jgi:murein L,D-transpeptidase YafK
MKTLLVILIATLLFLTGLLWSFGQNDETLQKMKNPLIVIKKKERTLELFDGGRLVKTYKIALGFAPEGDKQREGDGKTPEGEFYIFTKNDKSKFYLSLGLSYPNVEDATRGLQNELISQAEYDSIVKAISEKKIPLQNTKLGGEIYIHGDGSESDWTKGCIALTNEEIKELFDAIRVGTTVRIEV